jgi:hypothetical protein
LYVSHQSTAFLIFISTGQPGPERLNKFEEFHMPTSIYRKYILMSRSRYDEKAGVWEPYASVAADVLDEKNFYYHQLKDLNSSFETEEQAVSFGFIVARAWVDEHLSGKYLSNLGNT